MRKTSLECVYELAKKDPRVLFIGSDLGPGVLDDFKKKIPDRFFMEGVAEQYIIGMSAGLAKEGFIPYVNTISTFLTRRCYEQVAIDLCLHDLPVRLIGNGGGLVYAPLGPTHLAIEDLSLMKSIPNMTIISPCDANEMRNLMFKTLSYKHPIYITRHGQSENNVKRIIGGDPDITDEGKFYAVKLHEYINKELEDEFIIFTSCLKRTKQTAKHFTQKKIESRLLNEIHGGICENLSYDEIEEKYPNITTDRKKDKLRFRYPQGESYLDLFERLRYFVLQLTNYNKPILIVAHNAIIKVLLGYFEEKKHEDIPHSDIDLNTVIKLTPNSKNYDIEYKNLVNDIKN